MSAPSPSPLPSPRPIDGFVFDLDGTVYLGDAALPRAVEAIATLRARGKRVLFVSNKPLEPREAYAAKLTRLGIPTPPDNVITSGFVLGHHLAHTEPHLRLYVIGEEALRTELRGHGLTVLPEYADQDPMQVIHPTGIDAVVVARLGVPAHRCMMTGDRLETDILMGQQAGMVTTATLTGAATRADAEALAVPPDFVVNNLGEILELIV